MFCSLTGLVIPTPKHDEVLNEAPHIHHAARQAELPGSAYLVLNFSDPAPPSPRGVLVYATPRCFPFGLITRNLSSGM
jgi:hypothetical protein